MRVRRLTLGPLDTNCWIVDDGKSGPAVVIDPAAEASAILSALEGSPVAAVVLTHAHFDHIGGAGAIADALNPLPLVALHPNDHVLWRAGGGGAIFGFNIDPGPEPTIDFVHGQILKLGSNEFEVRFTPGHTTGHCVLYVATEKVCFCGDLIFYHGVGRTDLPGGDQAAREPWRMAAAALHALGRDPRPALQAALALAPNDGAAITEPDVKAGVDCKKLPYPYDGPGHNHLCFDIDDSFMCGGNNEVWIVMEYFDSGTAINCQYDSNGRGPVDGAFRGSADGAFPKLRLRNSGAWKFHVWHIRDGRFQNRGNGFDFRFSTHGAGSMWVNRVWVFRYKPQEPFKPDAL